MKLFSHSGKHQNFFLSKVRRSLHGIGRDPYVDWTGILFISVAVTVLVIFWGISSYIATDAFLSKEVKPSTTAISKTGDLQALKKIITEFDARQTIRAEAVKGYGGPGDPSL